MLWSTAQIFCCQKTHMSLQRWWETHVGSDNMSGNSAQSWPFVVRWFFRRATDLTHILQNHIKGTGDITIGPVPMLQTWRIGLVTQIQRNSLRGVVGAYFVGCAIFSVVSKVSNRMAALSGRRQRMFYSYDGKSRSIRRIYMTLSSSSNI